MMLYLDLRKETGNSYIMQLYRQLRIMILNGTLKENEKLPSSRDLAQVLRISRTTVMTSYDMLISEGLIFSKPGSGIFVSGGAEYIKTPEKLNTYEMTAFSPSELSEDTINFHSGTPALDLFPRNKWIKIEAQVMKEAPITALGYDYPNGRPEFRATLAAYLRRIRGINCHPDQILITTGAKQGLTLIAKSLLDSHKEVWIEDPTNANVRNIFSYHTELITPIAVDQKGIRTELFPKDRTPSLIFITPSHQFPLGGILPIQRRLELIRYAQENDCYIIEDDYDSEFKYKGLPINSMYELDHERVIYIGSFSKTLFPSIRLGYMLLPHSLIKHCSELKRLSDHHSNSLSQLTVMRFIDSGEMEHHILRMNRIYSGRRSQLISTLQAYFPEQVHILGEAAGLHVVAQFDNLTFTPSIMEKLENAGLSIITVEEHAIIKGEHSDQIILGYAHLSKEELEKGLLRLKQVLDAIYSA